MQPAGPGRPWPAGHRRGATSPGQPIVCHPNHVWCVDFVHDGLGNGRSCKMLTVLDEYTRRALAVAVRTRMGSEEVLEVLCRLFQRHGKPGFVRSGNGPEFASRAARGWLEKVGVTPIRINPGSPWSELRTTRRLRGSAYRGSRGSLCPSHRDFRRGQSGHGGPSAARLRLWFPL
ncbi:DDE-type integrase/transposase/recombinase [Leisingera sp. D0M16]|uniref:DDE-type integrase/transposase/recombinase n=1 Tax=Leisingera coralii TaxID=3351347 RepID=UPI003B82427A